MPAVLELAAQYRAQLAKQDEAALNRLINAYTSLYGKLSDKIELLARDVADGQLTPGQVQQLQRYKQLMAQTSTELTKFSNFTEIELSSAANASITMAGSNSLGLMSAAADAAGIAARFNTLPDAAIKQLLGFLDPQGPLFKRIEQLAPYNAQYVSDKLLEGVGLGYNPKKLASQIQDAFGGGLTDALRMTRTAQLYTYREASRANYVANSDVVDGWVWLAELDPDTCPSCIAQHGSVHPLDEPLNDHHNGRCASIPHIIDGYNPVKENGEDWFGKLSDAEQKQVLGAGRYEAFKAGKFEFGQLSVARPDAVYGEMRGAATLEELTA